MTLTFEIEASSTNFVSFSTIVGILSCSSAVKKKFVPSHLRLPNDESEDFMTLREISSDLETGF